MPKWIIQTSLFLGAAVGAFSLWVYLSTYHPNQLEPAPISCTDSAPSYDGSKPLNVLSYNIQYLAGKEYVFYYDLPGNVGPDLRPSSASIETTLSGMVDIIRDQNPDILLVQEFHDGAKATDYEDQLQKLQAALDEAFPCTAEAFYWKADFVPHPAIMGAVGMKLGTLSKFKITHAQRHQLPLMPADPVSQQFNLKRAVLETEIATQNQPITILNTHLDAFAQGSDTMTQQIAYLEQLFERLDKANTPWVIGGDFNLLAPGKYADLQKSQLYLYNPDTELASIWGRYQSVPSADDINGANPEVWFTHYPNDPDVAGPDRTIDYVFLSDHWQVLQKQVIQGKAETLSDHLPVQATLKLKKQL